MSGGKLTRKDVAMFAEAGFFRKCDSTLGLGELDFDCDMVAGH